MEFEDRILAMGLRFAAYGGNGSVSIECFMFPRTPGKFNVIGQGATYAEARVDLIDWFESANYIWPTDAFQTADAEKVPA